MTLWPLHCVVPMRLGMDSKLQTVDCRLMIIMKYLLMIWLVINWSWVIWYEIVRWYDSMIYDIWTYEHMLNLNVFHFSESNLCLQQYDTNYSPYKHRNHHSMRHARFYVDHMIMWYDMLRMTHIWPYQIWAWVMWPGYDCDYDPDMIYDWVQAMLLWWVCHLWHLGLGSIAASIYFDNDILYYMI